MITKYLQFIKESQEGEKIYYKSTNLIQELCVCMLLINNTFLDKILDKGIKSRYQENSQVFLTDLKNLLFSNNRLHLGKFVDGKCVIDDDTAKVNNIFNSVKFDIDVDWSKLVNSRIISRNIIDKLLSEEKVTEDRVTAVYWLGINQSKENSEDIVLELSDGRQYSFHLNKNITASKTASFGTFADDLVGNEIEKLYGEEYISKWNKLVQKWVTVIYKNVNKNIQVHMDKFMDESMIESLGYFQYFEMKHRDPRFKTLGEHIKEFNTNILYFSDLMKEIWKNKETCFMDFDQVYKEWMESKVYILNSKILEHFLTESITKNNIEDIKKMDDGFKVADGAIKMKLIKTIVEKLGCSERIVYYLGNNGNIFSQVPSRGFFRKIYDDITLMFDYHVKMVVDKEEENNNFNIKVKLEMGSEKLMDLDIIVKFSGSEMSDKLSCKYRFEFPDNFNFMISNKILSLKNDNTENQ